MAGSIRHILAPGTKAPRWFTALVVVALCGAGWWYVRAAVAHGNAVNARIDNALQHECARLYNGDKQAMEKAGRPTHAYDQNDQRVYMNYAKNVRDSGFYTFTPRMRMPAYMYLLGLAAGDEQRVMSYESYEEYYIGFFPRARAFNIGLSVVLLVAMFFALRPWLGNWLGVAFILVAAFQLFILKSPYVQPEVLQTAIITVTVAWIVRAIAEPRWWTALTAGLLLCLWHMTKANALVAVGLMGAVMGLKLLFAGKGKRLPILLAGPMVLVGYIVPMSPYLYNSWKLFGEPFYNTQSKYYMWAESKEEKHAVQDLGLGTLNSVTIRDADAPAKEDLNLPGPAKYWREHTWDHISKRLRRGINMMFVNADADYTALHLLVLVWAGILLWAAARRWPEAVEAMGRWKWEMLYVVALITVCVLLFGWFTSLKVGPRLLNSISLIPLFFFMLGTRWLLRQDTITVGGAVLSSEKVVTVGFIAIWLALTLFALPADLAIGYFAG